MLNNNHIYIYKNVNTNKSSGSLFSVICFAINFSQPRSMQRKLLYDFFTKLLLLLGSLEVTYICNEIYKIHRQCKFGLLLSFTANKLLVIEHPKGMKCKICNFRFPYFQEALKYATINCNDHSKRLHSDIIPTCV